MPANKKYLNQNKAQRIVKVTAALIGSLLVTVSSMLAIAVWVKQPGIVFMTYNYAFILIWCGLMLVAFLFENGWKCWLWYGILTVVFILTFFLGYPHLPS